jgi:phospholipid/cholesterol/gamma-HCH transport system substrate-binding protein
VKRLLRVVATFAVAALALSGCSMRGLQTYHLPGGATSGHSTYTVKACFLDVTALQTQASVRVGDVPVGDIEKIGVTRLGMADCPGDAQTQPGPLRAIVTMHVKKSVTLPANAVAYVQQTSLLGEKYVELGAPAGTAGVGRLASGAVIPEDKTHGFPDLEIVFGALSALLNGGGVEQLQTITHELSAALTGRESSARDLLHQLNTFVGGLDANNSEIVRAIDNLDRFAKILADQKTTIAQALDDIAPGLKILADQEPDLTKLLSALSNLGVVATRVINETKADTVHDLAALVPVLQKLAQAGTYLPRSLEVLLDYPFPKNVQNGTFGDYTGLLADVDLNTAMMNLGNFTGMGLPVTPNGQTPTQAGPSGKSPLPTLPVPKLPVPGVGGVLGPTAGGLLGPQNGADNGLLGLLMGGLQ